jgi:arginyl-tRNA synthetase
MSLRTYLHSILVPALKAGTPYENEPIQFDIPQQVAHGDFSTNVALLLAKKAKTNPRALAQVIVDKIAVDDRILQKIEIAGPGFINFFFKPSYLAESIKTIASAAEQFGRSNKHRGKRANVEFVSANPTGPLTVGHGRNAVFGDTVASLLEWVGYDVDREYYFNNAGRQMRVLGDSTRLRYLQLLGQAIEFPDTYYQGGYISEIAQSLMDEYGDSLVDEPAEGKFSMILKAHSNGLALFTRIFSTKTLYMKKARSNHFSTISRKTI